MPRSKMKPRTLVTGGAGFIGSHLVKRLLDEGRDVVIADDFSRGSMQNLRDLDVNIDCRPMDLRDYETARKAVKGANTVFHLAARVGSVEYLHGSNIAELGALQDNLVIDANVFRACVEEGVDRIVYTSSVSVYPIDLQKKYDTVFSEDDLTQFNPEGGYGWAKLLGEIQLGWMDGIRAGIARIFNVYGECAELEKGSQVIPALIRKAILYPKEEFVVWGDGRQTRCFLYVGDCVDALMKLEERASRPPLVVNVGSDKPVSIRELSRRIVKISRKAVRVQFDPSKPTGPLSRTAEISKAKTILQWQPTIGLNEGLERVYAWVGRRLVEGGVVDGLAYLSEAEKFSD